jgi:hypothetical protein
VLGIRQVATLSILASTALVGWLHRLADGAVLASRPLTLALFGAALVSCLVLARSAGAGRERSRPPIDPVGLALGAVACLGVLATYWGNEVDIGGDYRMHRMYAYQLLNGFPEPHEPYRGVAGHYPFAVHALLAVGVRLSGLTVHYAMLVVSAAVSLGVALTACRVAALAGLRANGARFFAGLLVAWGGAWAFELREFQLYLPAVQLAMPFLARNLALLLLLLGLELVLEAESGEGDARSRRLAAGVVAGLLGLTRPWEFGLSLAALTALAGWQRSRLYSAALAIALVVSAAYWLPLVSSWLELGIHAAREVGKASDLPTSATLYLPLAPRLVLACVEWRSMPWPIRGAAVGLVLLASVPLLGWLSEVTGVAAQLGLEGGLLKLERTGQQLALCVYALAAYGLDRAADRLAPRAVAVVALALLALGAATVLRVNGTFLDGRAAFPSPRWSQPPHYVRDLAGSAFYLRHLLDDARIVVLAPARYGHMTASRNGVEVVWSHQAVPIWARGTTGEQNAEERRQALDGFYEQLRRGRVDGGLLSELGARHFVWTAATPAALPEVRHLGPIGEFEGTTWHLLRVDAAEVSD